MPVDADVMLDTFDEQFLDDRVGDRWEPFRHLDLVADVKFGDSVPVGGADRVQQHLNGGEPVFGHRPHQILCQQPSLGGVGEDGDELAARLAVHGDRRGVS